MTKPPKTPRPKTIIGWRETVGLPDLGLEAIRAKIDTGARTSAFHAEEQDVFRKGGESWVRFRLPGPDGARVEVPVVEDRDIKNTGGVAETRIVIRTMLKIAGRRWKIDLSLADRAEMKFDLILGRTAIRRHGLLVDPGRSFLVSDAVDHLSANIPEEDDP